jgi:Cdc6-like AAA superfamily ATPase
MIGINIQTAITTSRRPTGELLDRLGDQISISLLSPYRTGPVTGSQFFGREMEIRRILGRESSNYAIVGIRRIGKTSLLRELARRLHENAHEEAKNSIVYLDCSDLDRNGMCQRY